MITFILNEKYNKLPGIWYEIILCLYFSKEEFIYIIINTSYSLFDGCNDSEQCLKTINKCSTLWKGTNK